MTEESSLLEHLLQDRTLLRRVLLVSGQGNVLQIGKYNIHLEQGQNLHIGDHIYQGSDVETLRQVMREVQAEIASDRYAASLQEYFRSLRRYCAELPYLTLTDIRPPKNLDEVYVPLRARQRENEPSPRKPAAQGASLTVEQVLHQAQTHHLLILGQPGAGKSTLLRQLAEPAYDDPHAIGLDRPHLPLLLPLRALARAEGALEERLNQALQNELRLTRALPDGFLDAWPQHLDAPWLFLLDGLDEVPADRYLSLKQWIGDLLAHPNIARVILTSRPSAYTEKEWESSRLSVYEIQPFTPDQTAELARRWFGEDAPAFLQALETVRSSVLTETPLLITIAAKVYLERKRLPERRAQLYQEFVDIWLDEARERGLRDELDAALLDLAQPALAHLALAMTEHPEWTEWTDEKSLIPVVAEYLNEQLNLKARAPAVAERFLRVMARRSGVFLKREERYGWVHPTFREYFAALALNQQLESGKSLEEVLGEKYFQPRWNDIIVGLTEICSQPAKMVTWLISQGAEKQKSTSIFLASYCWNAVKLLDEHSHSAIVQAFIAGLSAYDEDIRRATVIAIGKILKPTDESALDPLTTALYDSPDISMQASEALVKLDRTLVIERLTTAVLRAPYTYVRAFAADALGELGRNGETRAVNALISALNDFHPDVRWHAAKALAKIGTSAVEALISALDSSEINVRRGAAYALGEIGDIRAVQSLIAALHDDEPDIRYTAAEALGKIGDPRVLSELESLVDDETPVFLGRVRDAARKAIARIRERMAQTNQ